MPHKQHGTGGMVEHLLGCAAQDQASHRPEAPSADDNQIALLLREAREDLLSRNPLINDRLALEGRRQAPAEGEERFSSGLLVSFVLLLEGLGNFLGSRRQRLWRHPGRHFSRKHRLDDRHDTTDRLSRPGETLEHLG